MWLALLSHSKNVVALILGHETITGILQLQIITILEMLKPLTLIINVLIISADESRAESKKKKSTFTKLFSQTEAVYYQ